MGRFRISLREEKARLVAQSSKNAIVELPQAPLEIKNNSWQLLLRPDAQALHKDAFKRKTPSPTEINPRVNKIRRHEENMRNDRGCPRCPPHGGENAGRGSPSRHGAKKKKKVWKK